MKNLIWVLALGFAQLGFGQTIKVRALNETTGRGLPRQSISISLWYEKGQIPPAHYDRNISLETDAHGEARFNLPDPAPAHLAAQLRLTSEHWNCGCVILMSVEDLIQKGIVGPGPGTKSARSPSATPQPKEIMFLARPLTFFERIVYPFLRE